MNQAIIRNIEPLIIHRIHEICVNPVLYRDFRKIRDHEGLTKKQIITALNELAARGILVPNSYGLKGEVCWHWTKESLRKFNI